MNDKPMRPNIWYHLDICLKGLKNTVKLAPFLIKHHTMKQFERIQIQLQTSLTLALDGNKWSPSCIDHFTPKQTAT